MSMSAFAATGDSATRLVGRAAERAVLERLLAAVRGGESRALVLHGEPGVGKTALLELAYLAAFSLDVGESCASVTAPSRPR